ncbi:transcriptional regulator [Capnocytophaga sp. HP1101]
MFPLHPYYHPVQARIPHTQSEVSYREFVPTEALQPFIYCYWELKTNTNLATTFTYRVIADGCVDIFFNLTNPQESSLMGFCKNYTEFPMEGEFHYIGIRFLPAVFPLLFEQDASEVRQQEIPLRDIVPSLATFIVQHCYQHSAKEIREQLDHYFINYLAGKNLRIDNRFFVALKTILQHKGTTPIHTLNTGISNRQLRRLFDYYIGDSPKTFSKIVRFQHILSEKAYHNHSFLDTYYDQAHFIKDFKTFYGDTPSKVIV